MPITKHRGEKTSEILDYFRHPINFPLRPWVLVRVRLERSAFCKNFQWSPNGASLAEIKKSLLTNDFLTSFFRFFICVTRIGISVIIFSASKEIMVSMSRSIPQTCWMSLYWGCRANHSFSWARVVSASQSFSAGSVPSFPECYIEEKAEETPIHFIELN